MPPSSFAVSYLLLVTFFTPLLSNPEVSKIKSLNESPFQGVAVMLRDAYDTRRIHESDFQSHARRLKFRCRKDIWPWIFFNRFVGYKDGEEAHPSVKGTEWAEPFKSIKGMDIYNEAGALGDFFENWRISLRIAKQFGSPGIVVDPELYNNYNNVRLDYLAEQTARPVQDVRKRLEEIGKELTDLADTIYPEATIWFLATRLGNPPMDRTLTGKILFKRNDATLTCIVLGMLERAKENQSKLVFVSGGGEALGYCYHSLQALNTKIQRRQLAFEPYLKAYTNLYLGGTIAPWDRPESKNGFFITNGECRDSTLKTIDDFEPLLKKLISQYRYNFIYTGSGQSWNPYDERISDTYNKMLERALAETRAALQKR